MVSVGPHDARVFHSQRNFSDAFFCLRALMQSSYFRVVKIFANEWRHLFNLNLYFQSYQA